MLSRRAVISGAALAVAASIAVPVVAQALPEVKRYLNWYENRVKVGTDHQQMVAVSLMGKSLMGERSITLENTTLRNLTCQTVDTEEIWNEVTEGTEKGLGETTGSSTYACKAEDPCRVKNTRGEEVEGISLTAEAPPRLEGTEAHSTGISSVPWPGELIERETGKKQLLIHHAKYWMVLPPPNVGNGPGCLGTEIEFEEQEGASEKEAGDELAPLWVNGSKNGLKNSWMELVGQTGKTEKGFPITGRLISPTAGPGYFKAFPLLVGGLGGAWELITAE